VCTSLAQSYRLLVYQTYGMDSAFTLILYGTSDYLEVQILELVSQLMENDKYMDSLLTTINSTKVVAIL
jgi:hypothetical protein